MRDITEIATPVTELDFPLDWEEAVNEHALEVDYPFTAKDFEAVLRDRQPRTCWEGIQATLCPLGLVDLDPEDYPEGALAFVADGYVYVLHSAEELHAVQHEGMD